MRKVYYSVGDRMKYSKRCPVCNFSQGLRTEILQKRILLGSVEKTWKWFEIEHPMPDLAKSTFENHFRRHVKDEDYQNIIVPSSDHALDVGKTNSLYDAATGSIDAPVLELVSLYFLTAGRVKELQQRADKDPDTDQILLKYVAECRQQLKLINEIQKTLHNNSRVSAVKVSPSHEGESLYDAIINLEDPEGEFERLQTKTPQNPS